MSPAKEVLSEEEVLHLLEIGRAKTTETFNGLRLKDKIWVTVIILDGEPIEILHKTPLSFIKDSKGTLMCF